MFEKINFLRHSLSARLLTVFLVTSIFLTLVIIITLLYGFSSQWRVNIRPHLELYLDYISEDIGNPPNEQKATALSEKLPVHIYVKGPDREFSTNGQKLDVANLFFNKRGAGHHRRFKRSTEQYDDIEFGGDDTRTVLKKDIGEYEVFYELLHKDRVRERRGFILPALLAMLGSLALMYFIIRRMLRPVQDIRQGVVQMGQGKLTHRIPVRRNNDLGTLASSINTMASDIENMLDSKRQLLLGASHELRSPLTRAVVANNLLPESREQRQIQADLREMESLIADILESERMKSGHASLDREYVSVEELLEPVLADLYANNADNTNNATNATNADNADNADNGGI